MIDMPSRPWLQALRSSLVGGLACTVGMAWGQALGPPPAPLPPPQLSAQRLPADVEAALNAARVPLDAVAVVVQDVQARTPRVSWQAERAMNPASLMKLLPTLAALELLGPSHTWTTPVWLQGSVRDGVLDGALVIKGQGDPRLVSERLWLLLRRVQQLGVREIRGDIVLDRSAFSIPELPPGEFDGEPHRPYNANADALLLNFRSLVLSFLPDPASGRALVSSEPTLAGVDLPASVPLTSGGCGDWRGQLRADFSDASRIVLAGSYPQACGERHWPVAPADPPGFNARLLTALWRSIGGALSGRVREGVAPAAPPTFELVSPTLAEVVRDINKFSNNVMAQQLFLSLPMLASSHAPAGVAAPPVTVAAARETLERWAQQRLGTVSRSLVIDNGSGLSRDARASAAALARLLVQAWNSPVMPEFVASLPLAGADGTSRRMRGVEGRAHLKTGSLRDVAAVAGYVHAPGGQRYAVVAVANHPNASASRPAFERLIMGLLQEREPAMTAPGPGAINANANANASADDRPAPVERE
jgi:serine-type D-Ala-D-Ala carboxypeptidase/endopeptidase (penicillin-binding protein 4)